MCDQQWLRPACAYAQSDQSPCLSLEYSMSVKLLTEHNLEFLRLKEDAQSILSLHLSKDHIVGNHMSRLNYAFSQLRNSQRVDEPVFLKKPIASSDIPVCSSPMDPPMTLKGNRSISLRKSKHFIPSLPFSLHT